MAPPAGKLIVITGPTASGKTDLALAMAEELRGSPPIRRAGVVSADSRQVYAGMNIGTAKPRTAWSDEVTEAVPAADRNHSARRGNPYFEPREAGRATQEKEVASSASVLPSQEIPQYLFNIRYPNQPLSLSEWQTAAWQAIDQIHKVGMPAVLAGGTMLYVDSIIKNYDLPPVTPNPALRAELETKEADQLYAELLQKDPAARNFIQPLNKRRIIRALEVMAATGRPFSEQRRQRPPRYDITAIGLFDSWEALEERITQRVAAMLKDGLIEETRRLIDRYSADLPLLATLNYREAAAVLRGEWPQEKAREEMIRANLKYARRQMSWWRGRQDITWYSPADTADIKKRLLGA